MAGLIRVAADFTMPPNYGSLLDDIGGDARRWRDLDADNAQRLFAAMLAGEIPPLERDALLIAYRVEGGALAERVGFLRALDAHAGRLDVPAERARPVVLASYAGGRRHANLTALVALLLRRYGVPVLVHGLAGGDVTRARSDPAAAEPSRADRVVANGGDRDDDEDFGRITTAEVLRKLGIEPAASLADAQARLIRDNLAYVPTAVLAPGLARLLAEGARSGVRSSAHSVAKLIDPFGGDGYRVVGVSRPDDLVRMRKFLEATRADALLLLGTEGEPFANPSVQPQLEHFVGGVSTVCVEAESGRAANALALPATIDPPATAAWIAEVLAGTQPVPPPIVAQLACCLDGARRQVASA